MTAFENEYHCFMFFIFAQRAVSCTLAPLTRTSLTLSSSFNPAQFLIAVSNYTGAGKEDKLKFAFMSFDEDGNGVITKAELLKILKSNHMASHDAEVARKADTIMAQADKDGDGVITFDEFVIVSKKFPNILVSE